MALTILILLLAPACSNAEQTALPPATVPPASPTPGIPGAPPSSTPTPTLAPDTPTLETPALSPTAAATLTPSATLSAAPTLERLSQVQFIYHGDREKPLIALTFDLCQKPELPSTFDRAIYDVLMRYDVPATFFMGGDWMRTHPEQTQLLAANPKFELGNHSWSHPDLPDLNETQISAEIVKTQDMLYKLTGRTARLFRLPSGLSNDLTLSVLAWHGLYTIQWDVDSGDPAPDVSAERMNKAVRERIKNGSIILMHANGRGWNTAEALPEMIEMLQSQGYTLVTVSQLLGLEPIP
jgi:peptidoglycan/xylan/chitin deacetylase (PgdA/CDA1 family)